MPRITYELRGSQNEVAQLLGVKINKDGSVSKQSLEKINAFLRTRTDKMGAAFAMRTGTPMTRTLRQGLF